MFLVTSSLHSKPCHLSTTTFLYIILTICLPLHQSIDCDTSEPCECSDDAPCTLNCHGANACESNTLTCKSSQLCTVNCVGDSACNRAVITVDDVTHLYITCGSGEDSACAIPSTHCNDLLPSVACSIQCNHTLPASCNDLFIVTATTTPTPNTGKEIRKPIAEAQPGKLTINTLALAIGSVGVLLLVCAIWLVGFLIIKRHKNKYRKGIDTHDKREVVISGATSMEVRLNSESTHHKASNITVEASHSSTGTASDSSDSFDNAPPPPPLTTSMIHNPNKYKEDKIADKVTVCSSATTLYNVQQQYNDELMKSTRTVLTTATDGTDVSLYDTQNAYMKHELGLGGLATSGWNLRVANPSISETDASLYEKQHEYLQDEVNELEDEKETPGDEIAALDCLDVLYEDPIKRVSDTTDASIYRKQQQYMQQELMLQEFEEDEKKETPGFHTPGGDRTPGNIIQTGDGVIIKMKTEDMVQDEEEKLVSPRNHGRSATPGSDAFGFGLD